MRSSFSSGSRPASTSCESHFARDGFGGAFAIAGEHGEVRDFQMLEFVNCPASAFANPVAKQEAARQETVLGHQNRCRAVAVGFFQQRLQAGDIVLREESRRSCPDGAPRHFRDHAAARNDVRFVRLARSRAALPRFFQNGARQHVFRAILGGGGQRQHVGLAAPRCQSL